MIFSSIIRAQKEKDTLINSRNSVFYIDAFFGISKIGSLDIGFSLNYQKADNLFMFRRIYNTVWHDFEAGPDFTDTSQVIDYLSEHAILYGKRYMKEEYSYRFLLGISYNKAKYRLKNLPFSSKDYYIGLPFEFGIKQFKEKKKPFFRLGDRLSFGKPTAFGTSVGIKIYGNLSKESYIGIGLDFGFGFFKYY